MNRFASRPQIVVVLLLSFAVLPLTGQEVQDTKNDKEKPMLQCRVILREITTEKGVPNEVAAFDVEIKNISDKSIDIRFTAAPAVLQFMKGEVNRPDGTSLKFKCKDYLSPHTPTILTLRPGQATKGSFGSEGAQGPGVYRVQAFFEYENLKAVSPVVEVDLKPLKKK